jgi:hypothetical protein
LTTSGHIGLARVEIDAGIESLVVDSLSGAFDEVNSEFARTVSPLVILNGDFPWNCFDYRIVLLLFGGGGYGARGRSYMVNNAPALTPARLVK